MNTKAQPCESIGSFLLSAGNSFSPLVNEGESRLRDNYSELLSKIDRFSSTDCRIIDNREVQEAYSQTGTGYPVPDLWRGAEREVRTQHRTVPHRAASGPTLDCSGLSAVYVISANDRNVDGV
jgi:hypothetical protein